MNTNSQPAAPARAKHGPVHTDWMTPAPDRCECGSGITKDGNYYLCRDSGWFLG